jgi:hypothetical protein
MKTTLQSRMNKAVCRHERLSGDFPIPYEQPLTAPQFMHL